MKELNKNEIREIQLEILKKSVDFFEENELKYFLCGGTLLGAVRHQGYIPWDDDIDLMMPRPDYEKLKKIFSIEGFSLIDYNTKGQNYNLPFIKIQKEGTILKELPALKLEMGINIDIFPIDGFPNDKKELELHIDILKKFINKILFKNSNYSKQSHSVWWKSLISKISYFFKRLSTNFYSNRNISKRINKIAGKYVFGTENQSGIAVWGYGIKEVCPTGVFKETTEVLFEDRKYKSPKDFKTYLTCIYGDYLKLPPEKERVPHHNIKAFIKDIK